MMFRVCLLLVLVACACAIRVNVDSFLTDTPADGSVLTYDPKSAVRSPQSDSTLDANVLGGRRSIYITSAGGSFGVTPEISQCKPTGTSGSTNGNPTASVNANGGLSLSNPIVICNAGVFIRWDATAPITPGCDYYAANCVPTGTLNLNLASATSITIRAGADLAKTYFAVYVYSSDNNWCGRFQEIAQGTSQTGVDYTFPINSFSVIPTAAEVKEAESGLSVADFPQNCNLNNIVAFEVQLVGGLNWDQVLKSVSYDVPDLISISGNAFDDCGCVGSTSAPKNGVSVSIHSGSSASGTPLSTSTTSGSGGFTFGNLSPGTYTISVSGGGLCSSSSATVTRTFSASGGGVNFFYSVAGGVIQCPSNKDLTCSADTSVGANGNANFVGSCGAAPSITSTDAVANQPCTPGGITRTITRTFSAGGQSCIQTLTVRDDRVAPQLVAASVPASRSIGCTDSSPTELPTATGSACNTVSVTVVESNSNAGQCDVNTCSRSTSFTRTFTPVDNCGNTGASATQTITRNCATSCPACPSCPTFNPTTPVTSAPKPVVGPLNCKFICDDADSSAVATMVSLLVVVVLAVFAL